MTYGEEGITCGAAPADFNADHFRCQLGHGANIFERAVSAIRTWVMFDQGWVLLESGGRPPDVGTTVAIIVRVGPVWWANACRVVYVVDETEPVRRVGFANGTLPGHAECGEEVFVVEMDAAGDVWYDLRAYSRPRHWLARAGLPVHPRDAAAVCGRFGSGDEARAGRRQCSFERMTMADVLEIRSGYDRWAAVYDHDANPLQALEGPQLCAAVGDPRGLDALDLGCGTGRHSLWLAAAAANLTAIDFSEGMLARRVASRRGGDTLSRARRARTVAAA